MRWSPQQDQALIRVAEWYNDPARQVCRVFGFAGTGKTTLARHFAEGVGGHVLYGAYTGKAAHVLRKMGCESATTIHSHIYQGRERGQARLKEMEAGLVALMAEIGAELPRDDPPEVRQKTIDGNRRVRDLRQAISEERESLAQPAFILNPDSEVKDAKLVIIDECSMVDGRVGSDLLSFGTKVLVLGDPAQLPPVMGGGFFTEGHEPDVMLTEIHRQARDNPIIAMATKVRNEEALDLGRYGESEVTARRMEPEEVLAAGQVLVGRNKTRHASNARVRFLKELPGPLPVPGDRLVCLRNNHEHGLLNGAIWIADDVSEMDPERVFLTAHSEDDEDTYIETQAHTHYFLGREESLGWWERKEADEFDYGYAMTVHKAQGSQWDNVMVFDESWCFRQDRHRWLYTALTRAADKVTVVRL